MARRGCGSAWCKVHHLFCETAGQELQASQPRFTLVGGQSPYLNVWSSGGVLSTLGGRAQLRRLAKAIGAALDAAELETMALPKKRKRAKR